MVNICQESGGFSTIKSGLQEHLTGFKFILIW